jgi:putative hemolysin
VIPFASGGGVEFHGTLGQAAGLFVALFMASFFFSGTETALFSLQKLERQRLAAFGRSGERVLALLDRRSSTISTLLIGNETANVMIATVGAALFATLTPDQPWLNVVVLTPALLLFSEITPKVLAYRLSFYWALLAVWPLTAFGMAIAPVRWAVTGLVGGFARAFRVTTSAEESSLDENELRTLITQGAAAGDVDVRERDLIEAVFDFDDLTVGRLMSPRPDLVAVTLDTPWAELLRVTSEHRYSRVPVYEGRLDNVIGVLLIKDLLRYRHHPVATVRQLRSILLPPVFVPQSKPADAMLREFLSRKFHMALVVDEHGTLVGACTLDDLLAELVGELLDQDDASAAAVEETRPGVLTVQGDLDVDDFAQETGIVLPEGDYHTVAGFVFHELGRLPRPGDQITVGDHAFEVAGMDGRRITILRVSGATPAPAPEASL